MPGYVSSFVSTGEDGSYRIHKIPPGRYILLLNPEGPYDDWPFDLQFYPSALRREDATVLQMAEGQQIQGADFRVQRLKQRTVRVRVTSPNGKVAADAPVCLAYDHTRDYEPLLAGNCFKKTDQNGIAEIHLYGDSRVRLFAEQFVSAGEGKPDITYYSHFVESKAQTFAESIPLVVNSLKPE